MVPPKLTEEQINGLAPGLSLDFPSCYEWSMDEIAKQMAIDRHNDMLRHSEKNKKN